METKKKKKGEIATLESNIKKGLTKHQAQNEMLGAGKTKGEGVKKKSTPR